MQHEIGQWVAQQAEGGEDPFVEAGSRVRYLQEHSFVIHIQEKPQVMQVLKEEQSLRVKVVGDEGEKARSVRIQLTSDSQIYFNFICDYTDWEFKRIKAQQGLLIEFKEYPELIVKTFQKLLLKNYFAVFTIFSETEGKLAIVKKSEFKDTAVMEFQFVRAPEELIRKSIQYRYNTMLANYALHSAKYQSVCEVIKAKNPSLLMQINKILKKKP